MANRKAAQDFHQKLIRLPRELHTQLEDLAARNERNTEAEIRFALREYVEREKAAA